MVTDRPIYLDYQATTPVDPRVFDAMKPYLAEAFGNPHSDSHAYGHEAADAVEIARAQVADLIGAEPREIVFTSGATEANNIAILGTSRFFKGRRGHIVTLETEHKCTLESCRQHEKEGGTLTILPVRPDGLVDPADIQAAITDETALVSVMAVNNEIGVMQPLAEIGAICKARGITLHTDAAQAFGKIPLDVRAMNIGLMSISGHKAYGPKGIGVLFVRRRPRVRLEPLFFGGGQERGIRSGTLPAPLCVAIGEAARVAGEQMTGEAERFAGYARLFLDELDRRQCRYAVNGSTEHRFSGNLNLTFDGASAFDLMQASPGVAVSAGSACTSAVVEPSYVLKAIGLSDDAAASSLRIGFGRPTTDDEVRRAAGMIAEAAASVRNGDSAAA